MWADFVSCEACRVRAEEPGLARDDRPRSAAASRALGSAVSRAVSLAISLLFFSSLQAQAEPPAQSQSRGQSREEADRFDAVVLDAGHGGHDEGAKGVSGLQEKDLVLDVARRLAERLRGRGVRVVLTRDADRFLSLEERTAVANDARADLFLSIHANASRSKTPKGVETYFASLDATDDDARATAERENEALGAKPPTFRRDDPLAAILGDLIETQHLQESSEFAKLAQLELSQRDRVPSRGVKQAPFVVLMGVQMPASLVEIGFLSNPSEEARLRRGRRRDVIAEALADAVSAFAVRYDARRGVAETAASLQRAAR